MIGRRQVGHLGVCNLFQLRTGHLAHLDGVWRTAAFGDIPAAFFSSTAAGGVLVMKVKLRSL